LRFPAVRTPMSRVAEYERDFRFLPTRIARQQTRSPAAASSSLVATPASAIVQSAPACRAGRVVAMFPRAIDTALPDNDGLKWFNWLYLQGHRKR